MARAIRALMLTLTLALAGCIEDTGPSAVAPQPARTPGPVGVGTLERVAQVEMPVAERMCRARGAGRDCGFQLVLDTNPSAPANAFQSMARDGHPQITVTKRLLQDLDNTDELAFILGHEAAHHILGHLGQTSANATIGALAGGLIASALGADYAAVDAAQQGGAMVGSRVYSKDFELQADELGTIITCRAGYNPVRGAQYFARIRDPGNKFLGSHPPNGERIQAVSRTAAANC